MTNEEIDTRRQQAEAGDTAAACLIGDLSRAGVEIAPDEEVVIKWYVKAALNGSTHARYWLNVIMRNGGKLTDCMADLRVSAKRIERRNRNPSATTLKDGNVTDFSAEILATVKSLAEQEHNDARCVYGILLKAGWGCVIDLHQASQCFLYGALDGHAGCMNNLGVMCEKGEFLMKDTREAAEWYRKAAEQGDPSGQANLARMYAEGYGVDFNIGKALELYRLAVKNGSISAQLQLQKLYDSGRGLPFGESLPAVEWFTEAAEHDPAARYHLARYYEKGIGVPANTAHAFELYRSAAEEGYFSAQTILSKMYTFGWGTPTDAHLAFEWCYKRAAMGDEPAVSHLAYLYTHGIGVPQNIDVACRLYLKYYSLSTKKTSMEYGYQRVGMNLFKQRQYREAFDIFTHLVREHKQPADPLGVRRYEPEVIHWGAEAEWNREYNQAVEHQREGQLIAAWRSARNSLEIAEERLDPDHVDLAASINLLGEIFMAMGEQAVANALFRRALAMRVRKLGRAHHEVAETLQLMGAYPYVTRGVYEKDFEKAFVDGKSQKLIFDLCASGRTPLTFSFILLRLSQTLYHHGNTDLGHKAIKMAMTVLTKELGNDHPVMQEVRELTVAIKEEKGEFDKFAKSSSRGSRRN
jgi:TPR repeat protein